MPTGVRGGFGIDDVTDLGCNQLGRVVVIFVSADLQILVDNATTAQFSDADFIFA